jgi:hypothetical protein
MLQIFEVAVHMKRETWIQLLIVPPAKFDSKELKSLFEKPGHKVMSFKDKVPLFYNNKSF